MSSGGAEPGGKGVEALVVAGVIVPGVDTDGRSDGGTGIGGKVGRGGGVRDVRIRWKDTVVC